jgi:hypothetical protein
LVLPEETGMGLVPQRAAKLAGLVIRAGVVAGGEPSRLWWRH